MSTNIEKIALPCLNDHGLEAEVTTRFGRCAYFTIVTLDQGNIAEIDIVENQAANAMGGAGPMAAQLIAQEGATVVIGGHYGPNAFNALVKGKITMFGPFAGNVATLIAAYKENKIAKIEEDSTPTPGLHSGPGQGRGQGRGMGQGRGQGQGRRQ